MKLSEKIQEALREQQEINLSDPAAQKRLAAQWGYVPAGAQPAPSVPREAIEKMLTQLMDIAVSNGANSVSMPDEYVEVAAWLCGIPAQSAPSVPVVTPKMEQAFYEKVDVTSVGSIRGLADGIKAAMLAAAPETKP